MLADLRSYENLGTPQYFFELLKSLNIEEATWTKRDVEQLFYNRIVGGQSIFDGGLILAEKIELLTVSDAGIISLNDTIKNFLFSEKQMCDKIVELLFLSLKDDLNFHEIFSSKNISYDIIYHTIQISNSAFSFRYGCFKQLLIDFDVLRPHPVHEIKNYIVNLRYKKIFDKVVLPEIKRRKIGIDELRNSLAQQQLNGEEAEKFVLEFERARLNNKEGIDWVAEYSVAEGFDISSFETYESVNNDRFIEVKSYSGNPYFFWSRNEVDIARIKGEKYFLYLVDRSQMSILNYQPVIIQNPYQNVLQHDGWCKEVEKYKVSFIRQ